MSNEKTDRRIGQDTNNYARCPRCREVYLPHDGHECKTSASEKVERK
jgi:hypothetical protein